MPGEETSVLNFRVISNRRISTGSAPTLYVNMDTPINILPILTICQMRVSMYT